MAPPSERPQSGLAALLKAQNWPRLRADLLRFACHVARSRQAADDLVQEALRRAIDPEGDLWDPDVEPLFAKHVMRIIDNIHRGERDKREVRLDPRNKATVEERTTRRSVTPEDAALDAEGDRSARKTLEAVRADLRDDPLALRVVELSENGVDRPAEQAAATGARIEEIRNARKRVQRAIEAVLHGEKQARSPSERDVPDVEGDAAP
jgi:DNA-directed RNA polymerase specialized sigma24 family protein